MLIKHNVRRQVFDSRVEADDLSLLGSRFGRLLLQGTVEGKCYLLVVEVVEVVDRNAWLLRPVTGYRCSSGDPGKGGAR